MSDEVEMNEKNPEAETNEENCETEASEKTRRTEAKVALVYNGRLPENLVDVGSVERTIWIQLSYYFEAHAQFYLDRIQNNPAQWITGIDLYGASLGGRGQEVIKRALLKLGMPTMYQLAGKAIHAGVAVYQESDVDIYKKDDEGRCLCGFEVVVSEETAEELLDRLKTNTPDRIEYDRYQKIWLSEMDSDEDKVAEQEDKVAEQEDEEQYEETLEFRGPEGLRQVYVEGTIGDSKYGTEYNCTWTKCDGGAWELRMSVLDYDAVHSDGQLIIEVLLEGCGLPGMAYLSEMADCEERTPKYGEWYNEWLYTMRGFSNPDEVDDEDRESCYFSATFREWRFLDLLEEMQAKIPKGGLLFMYEE